MPILPIADKRAGRNGADPPWALQDNECVEAVNVDWFGSTLARKRGGADSLSMTSSTMAADVASLYRHVPSTDLTAAELWAVDFSNTVNRLAGGTTWAAPSLVDAGTLNGANFSFASVHGKLFIAYQSAQPRLHVWDGTSVRRTGLPAPASAPTVADHGSGSYAAVLRYYRVRFLQGVGLVVLRLSEPSASVSFTPSGSGASARVTQPTPPGEGETSWLIEGSADNATWSIVGNVLIGTTTFDDTNAVSTYTNQTLFNPSPAVGTFTLQPSAKFIAADQGRLLMFGDYTTANPQNRITVSAVVGSLNEGDEERVDTTVGYYINLDEKDSGPPMGLVGPVNGSFFAFTWTQFWKLTPTGIASGPYQPLAISKTIGLVAPKAVCIAEDEWGRAALYWMSPHGPYRWGANGLEYIGRGVEDLLLPNQPNSQSVMNLNAANVIAHCVFHPDKRQVWFWFATSTNDNPDSKIVYNIGRYPTGPNQASIPSGWARHTGNSALALCSCLFSKTVGASMSKDLKPYIGYLGAADTIYVCDSTTTNDAGSNFQAYITDKVRSPWTPNMNGSVNRCYLLAQVSSGVTITQSLTPDYGLSTTTTSTASLTASGSETRVVKRFEDAGLGDIGSFRAQWGDASAVSNSWQLDAAFIEWEPKEPR